MPTTDEFWSINGVSLHELGWNVTTVGGGRYALPPKRGSNITLAKRAGQVFRPKLADSRIIDLQMWVAGADPVTGQPTGDSILAWNDNWDTLRRLVWQPAGQQVELTRRWNLSAAYGGVKTLLEATALAEIADTMEPSMTGRNRATFTMSLALADPYFYGAEQSYDFTIGQSHTINNPGHDIADGGFFDIDFYGPLTDVRLTNTAFSPEVYIQANNTVPAGVMIRASIPDYTFRTIVGYNIIGIINHTTRIRHSGYRSWMALYPGDNTLTLTGTGSGHVELRYRPPYI